MPDTQIVAPPVVCGWTVGPVWKLGGETCSCILPPDHMGAHLCSCGSSFSGCGRPGDGSVPSPWTQD